MQGLLFYDNAGTAAFYTTDGQGGIYQTRRIGRLLSGRPWTHIIPGQFGGNGNGFTDLLFYDGAGTGIFYTTDGQARFHGLRGHYDWQSAGRPWTHIIPGEFGGPIPGSIAGRRFTDLLFYDSAGTGAFYATDGQGGIRLLRTHTGWVGAGVPWTHIIPGKFSDVGFYTDLLFYDSAGTGAFYSTYEGQMYKLRRHADWQSAGRPWTHIIPGNFGGPFYTDLLFYDGAGTGAFYSTDGQGGIHLLRTHTGWVGAGIPWTHIIPGQFATESLCVGIHFKSLLAITSTISTFIDDQFAAMRDLFATVGINAMRGTTEDLSGNVFLQPLQNLNVGACLRGVTTQDQNDLFANRNNVGNNEIVVYIVSTLIGGIGNFVGCASHPVGQPGAAVIQNNARWLTAHEVAHVLGLIHVIGQSDSLMFPNTGWTNVPPDLADSEELTMRNSDLTNPC